MSREIRIKTGEVRSLYKKFENEIQDIYTEIELLLKQSYDVLEQQKSESVMDKYQDNVKDISETIDNLVNEELHMALKNMQSILIASEDLDKSLQKPLELS